MVQIVCYLDVGNETKMFRSAMFHESLKDAKLNRTQMIRLLTDITDKERAQCFATGRVHIMDCIE